MSSLTAFESCLSRGAIRLSRSRPSSTGEGSAGQQSTVARSTSLSWPKCSAMPAAPIHATPHFVAFFVPRFVVYASSQAFVETTLDHPYLHTRGGFIPALYPIPGLSAHPNHARTNTIPPHKPGSATKALPGLWGDSSLNGKRGHDQAPELEEPTKRATKRRRRSVR